MVAQRPIPSRHRRRRRLQPARARARRSTTPRRQRRPRRSIRVQSTRRCATSAGRIPRPGPLRRRRRLPLRRGAGTIRASGRWWWRAFCVVDVRGGHRVETIFCAGDAGDGGVFGFCGASFEIWMGIEVCLSFSLLYSIFCGSLPFFAILPFKDTPIDFELTSRLCL